VERQSLPHGIMDKIQEAIARHGNVWTLQTNTEMNQLYEPLHAQRAAELAKTVKTEKAIKYGTHERNRLDIYQPAEKSNEALPVVVFFHGGTNTLNP
jgi:acetyl esterase/lipase